MDAEDRRVANNVPEVLPDGWKLVARDEVPLGTILEFSRAGWFGPRFTVMASTFEEALRRGRDRMRWYDQADWNQQEEDRTG